MVSSIVKNRENGNRLSFTDRTSVSACFPLFYVALPSPLVDPMRKILLLTVLCSVLFGSGCCTKEDCIGIEGPIFRISFSGFGTEELVRDSVLILYAATMQPYKKVQTEQFENTVMIQRYAFTTSDDNAMRDFAFVLFTTGSRRDTISDIVYQSVKEKIDCGTCFPFGKGSTSADGYRNLSFKVNGLVHTDPSFTITR